MYNRSCATREEAGLGSRATTVKRWRAKREGWGEMAGRCHRQAVCACLPSQQQPARLLRSKQGALGGRGQLASPEAARCMPQGAKLARLLHGGAAQRCVALVVTPSVFLASSYVMNAMATPGMTCGGVDWEWATNNWLWYRVSTVTEQTLG